MFVQGIVFFLATLAIQSEFWTWRLKKEDTEMKVPEEIGDLDEDVEKERSRILNSNGQSDVLQVSQPIPQIAHQACLQLFFNDDKMLICDFTANNALWFSLNCK